MTKEEHKDVYIAAAVGGVALVLMYLYLHYQSVAATAAAPATATAPVGQTAYNYNIAPYNPAPAIPVGSQSLPPNTPPGGGCCDQCGPDIGSQYFNTTVAQYQTLIGA